MRDLRELGGEAARLKARELVQAWFDGGRPGGGAAADITARRVVHWIGHFSFFCASADDDFRRAFMAQIAADAANLRRTLSLGQTGSSPLVVFKGVLWATLFLTGGLDGRRHFERWLNDALAASFDANGGPIDRAPDSAARALADLIDIRQAFRAAGHEEPEPVASAIEAATAWVRMMRHGDGGLACFNGAAAMSGPDLDHLLTVADSKARALREAPDSGYMRLVGGARWWSSTAGLALSARRGAMPRRWLLKCRWAGNAWWSTAGPPTTTTAGPRRSARPPPTAL